MCHPSVSCRASFNRAQNVLPRSTLARWATKSRVTCIGLPSRVERQDFVCLAQSKDVSLHVSDGQADFSSELETMPLSKRDRPVGTALSGLTKDARELLLDASRTWKLELGGISSSARVVTNRRIGHVTRLTVLPRRSHPRGTIRVFCSAPGCIPAKIRSTLPAYETHNSQLASEVVIRQYLTMTALTISYKPLYHPND